MYQISAVAAKGQRVLEAQQKPEPAGLRFRIAKNVAKRREQTGRSLADVAAAAGIGKSTLHAIEAADANPGIETLWALANALEVPFGELLDQPTPVVRVVRAGQGPRVGSEDSTMEAFLLATTGHAARVELYELRLQPGKSRRAQAHIKGTVEHVMVTSGLLRVGPSGATEDLAVGDLVTFAGDGSHEYEALEPQTSAVLMIEYR